MKLWEMQWNNSLSIILLISSILKNKIENKSWVLKWNSTFYSDIFVHNLKDYGVKTRNPKF